MRRNLPGVGTRFLHSLLWTLVLALPLSAAPANLARGKTYTSSVSASASYPDTLGKELTNGSYAAGDYSDAQWQGRANAGTYFQTVDLGQVSQITKALCNFLKNSTASINWPQKVSFSTSTDGAAFKTVGSAAAQTAVGSRRKYLLQLSTPANARFVRMTVSGSAWIFEDELEIWGELATPAAAVPQILGGSFIQPWLCEYWTSSNFATEFNAMKALKMDHVIWQWVADSKAKTTFYPTAIPGFRQRNSGDPVALSLQQARIYGLKVWFGLNDNADWWSKYANDPLWLQNEVNVGKQIVQEIWNRYGAQHGDVIAGFYIEQEVDNWNFSTTAQEENLRAALQDLTNHVHANTGKPVLLSPYFNESGGATAAQYGAMWQRILTSVPLDVIALQDGIGAGHSTLSTVGTWFAALKNAIAAARPATELWANVETFTPAFSPAPIDRVISQINAEKGHVKQITCFSFNHYDSPQQGFTNEYNSYKSYVDSVP